MRTLFFDQSGPLVRWQPGLLRIADLNPQTEINWRFSRWELFVLGLKCLWASVR